MAPSLSSFGLTPAASSPIAFDEDRRNFMHANKIAWEKAWEKELKELWDGPSSKLGRSSANFATSVPRHEAKLYASSEILDQTALATGFCCKKQREFTAQVLSAAGSFSVEHSWRGLQDDVRRDVILNGICAALDDPLLQTARRYCPESTVEHLSSNGGEPYLDAIRVLTQYSWPTNTFKSFPHPAVDHYLRMLPSYEKDPGYKTLMHTRVVLRTRCLLTIFAAIFDAFCIRVCTGSRMCECRDHRLAANPAWTQQDAERERCLKELRDPSTLDSKTAHTTLKLFTQLCRVCLKGGDEVGHKLLCCKKCRAGGRSVYYCSRECQLQDWHHGLPRPHKQTCGRPLDEDVLVPATDSEAIPGLNELLKSEDVRRTLSVLFPKPYDWFEHPLALRRQTSFLMNQAASVPRDAVCMYALFFEPEPILIRRSDYSDVTLERYFLLHRHYAFKAGFPDSVVVLGILIGYAIQLRGQPVPYGDIVQQLEREYAPLPGVEGMLKTIFRVLYNEGEDASQTKRRVLQVMRITEQVIFKNPDGPSRVAVDEENVTPDAVNSIAAEAEPPASSSSSRL